MAGQFEIGDVIEGRYHVYQVLGGKGKSGMGVVYVCLDKELGIVNALKSFQDGDFDKAAALKERFRQESLAWIQLKSHPHIVHAYSVYDWHGKLFIVLEYVAPDDFGRNTLPHYFNKRLDIRQVLEWSLQFCHGMEYACSQKVTPHRDIKPDNLMISSTGVLKITDFGLARQTVYSRRESGFQAFPWDRKNNLFGFFGSPPWMSPEQFEGHADLQSDIYSFGVVLYQMESGGKLPFIANESKDFYALHKNKAVPSLQSKLFPIIKKCLGKKPSDRYKDFFALRQDLENYYKNIYHKSPPELLEHEGVEYLEHFNSGLSLRNLGLLDDAVREYEKCISINSEFVDAHINLGFVLQEKRNFKKATSQYELALKKDPNNYKALVNIGAVLLEQGKQDEALSYLERGLSIEEDDYIARHNLAKIYFNKGLREKGIAEAERALFQKPENVVLRIILANELLLAKRVLDAVSEYQKVLSYDPGNGDVHLQLGNIYLHQGDIARAKSEFILGIKLKPQDADGCYYLGNIFLEENNLGEAVNLWRQAIRINKNYLQAYNNLGTALLRQEKLDEAGAVIKAGLEVAPNDQYLRYNLGCVYSNKGLFSEAIVELEKAISLGTEIAEVYYLLGEALAAAGRKEESVTAYKCYVDNKQDFDDAQECLSLGTLFLERGLMEYALKMFEAFSKLVPNEDAQKVAEIIQMIKQSISEKKG